jgi:hypothetical protein
MQLQLSHPAFKTQRVAIETAGWFTGPKLVVNGSIAKKQKGTYLVVSDSGTEVPVRLKYNFLDPIPKVTVAGEPVALAPPLKWYEYAWAGLPVLLVFAGGAIGGFVGALGACASGRVFRSDRGAVAKYGLSALITVGAFVAFVILAAIFQLLVGMSRR